MFGRLGIGGIVKATFLGWLVRAFLATATAIIASPANATTITFEGQPGFVKQFPDLTPGVATPQQVFLPDAGGSTVDVTVDGGLVLIDAQDVDANDTAVYGTACFGMCDTPVLLNPLTVTFDSPIENFFLEVFSGFTREALYRVSDNNGNSADFLLPPGKPLSPGQVGGWQQIGFAATGTIVHIQQLTLGNQPVEGLVYDFFIDNIHFNEPLPPLDPVPEPGSMLLLGSGLAAAVAARRRRRRIVE
jgi:hypothetical protein